MKTILVMSACMFCLNAKAQIYREGSIDCHLNSSKKERLVAWWGSNESYSNKKVIDTLKIINNYKIIFAGSFPVQYAMYGSTSDGGIVKFKLQILGDDKVCTYQFIEVEHYSTPGVKHKNGGPLINDKPLKGSLIFGKTWSAYKEQANSTFDEAGIELEKILKL